MVPHPLILSHMTPIFNVAEHNHSSKEKSVSVVDIRGSASMSNTDESLKKSAIELLSVKSVYFTDSRIIRSGGNPSKTLIRSLPTMILYDHKGLDIFNKITYDEDYYLTNAEIEILQNHSAALVREHIVDGNVLIELGSGAMRKTKFLLEEITRSRKSVTYYAVDLSDSSLKESLDSLAICYPSINFVGLWGTYHDSLEWIKAHIPSEISKIYLWLGSSIGNLTRQEAHEFLNTFSKSGMNDGDLFLCGIDRRNSYDMVSLAYNDRSGLTRQFAMNGLDHLNKLFGFLLMNPNNFEYISIYNEIEGRHEAYFESLVDQTINANNPPCLVHLKKGELINFEYSYKYSSEEVDELIQGTELALLEKLTNHNEYYDMHV
jgi:EasF-like predicted methyltransferase